MTKNTTPFAIFLVMNFVPSVLGFADDSSPYPNGPEIKWGKVASPVPYGDTDHNEMLDKRNARPQDKADQPVVKKAKKVRRFENSSIDEPAGHYIPPGGGEMNHDSRN